MNHNNKLKFEQKKPRVKWWAKGLIWGLIFAIGIINFSCEKENAEDSDEYYVTYEVSSSTIYHGGKLDVTINTENNQNMSLTISERITWEIIIGPVQKGFNATLKVNSQGETYNKLRLYTNIYVSKNGSPFALKKYDGSDTPRDSVQINYTIDY